MLQRERLTTDVVMENKLNRYDYILFVIVFICPYSDSGIWWTLTSFIPPLSTLGSSILAFTLSLYLFQYSLRSHFSQCSKVFYSLVLLATIWSVIKFVETIFQVGFVNAITVYRMNYILLPTFLLCMSYISNMSITRLEKFAILILKWLPFISIAYFLQCSGLNLFNVATRIETTGGISVVRNIIGMPPIMPVIFAFCFISYLYKESRWSLIITLICLGVLFFSYTRNLIASSCIIIISSIVLYVWRNGLKDKYKLIFYAAIGIAVLLIVFPNSFQFWSNLIDSTINSQLVKEEGTYAFREKLIAKALYTIENHHSLWTGLGYIRDAPKGDYSFVLGTDTYVAPILWCEGLLGMILRCLPCIYLLFKSCIKFFHYSHNRIGKLSLIIFTSILSQIPNYVQTSIFMEYNFTIALLYMIYIYMEIMTKNNYSLNSYA